MKYLKEPQETQTTLFAAKRRSTATGLSYLADATNLKKLDLRRNRHRRQGLGACVKIYKSAMAWTASNKYHRCRIRRLAKLPNLKFLNLAHTGISDHGLKHIGNISGLETLDLTSTMIADAGLVHLYELKNLKILTLAGTDVTAAGAEKLQKALPHCQMERE